MDNFIFCKTCHTANDLDSDFCTECGYDLIDNVYFDSTNNTHLTETLLFSRKTGYTAKAEFKLTNTGETVYTISAQSSQNTTISVLLIMVAVMMAFPIALIVNIKLNGIYTTILFALVFGIIAISFQSVLSITYLIQTPDQILIGKIILRNLIKQNKWYFIDSNSSKQFQLTFSSKFNGQLQMYDQSYSVFSQKHNRDACTVSTGKGQPIAKAINESHKPYPRSFFIYYSEKFHELEVVFVTFSIIMKNFTLKTV